MMSPDGPMADFKERFFRYFQHEVTALQEEMEQLPNTSTINGERNDAVDHCLAGIARLSQEVNEARIHLPTYDQQTYAAAVKALSEKLTNVRNSFAPRPKFTFKAALKTRAKMASPVNVSTSGGAQQTEEETDAAADVANLIIRDASAKSSIIHHPDFESARSISLKAQKDVFICVLPASRGRDGRAARILEVEDSVVDLRGASQDVAHPLAALTIKGISNSVLVCGRVSGAVHVTGLKDVVLVAACRQLRMHECVDVSIYLHCASKPIIEACKNVGFAPLPEVLIDDNLRKVENRWSEVDDFNWLKAEASPNWHIVEESDRLANDAWDQLAKPKEGDGLVGQTLEAFKVSKMDAS